MLPHVPLVCRPAAGLSKVFVGSPYPGTNAPRYWGLSALDGVMVHLALPFVPRDVTLSKGGAARGLAKMRRSEFFSCLVGWNVALFERAWRCGSTLHGLTNFVFVLFVGPPGFGLLTYFAFRLFTKRPVGFSLVGKTKLAPVFC